MSYERRRSFFNELSSASLTDRVTCVMITHVLPDRMALIPAITSILPISTVLAIPYSTDAATLATLQASYDIRTPALHELLDAQYLTETVLEASEGKNVLLLDIGGYFGRAHAALYAALGDRLVGVVEDTESGHREYQKISAPQFPIISVARSALKNAEDRLVGKSIAYSIEKAIRDRDAVTSAKQCLVLGFGKVGQGIACSMRDRGFRVTIYDTDAARSMEALSQDFACPNREIALRTAQLIIGATGANSVSAQDLSLLSDGCWLISGSSKDVEFPVRHIKEQSNSHNDFGPISTYDLAGKRVVLFAGGQPLNFIDGAVMGEFIAIVQAEIIASIICILGNKLPNGLQELPVATKSMLAGLWMQHFVCPDSGTLLVDF